MPKQQYRFSEYSPGNRMKQDESSQPARQGAAPTMEATRRKAVTEAYGAIPQRDAFNMGYNMSAWMHKLMTLFGQSLTGNTPYPAQLNQLKRTYIPPTDAPMGPESWVRSINQVNLPRNMFNWHPVPELANLPVAGGTPGSVQQQYIMVQPSQQLLEGILAARRMVPQTQTPTAYGSPLATVNPVTGTVVTQRVTPSAAYSITQQAQGGSQFFTWLKRALTGG